MKLACLTVSSRPETSAKLTTLAAKASCFAPKTTDGRSREQEQQRKCLLPRSCPGSLGALSILAAPREGPLLAVKGEGPAASVVNR